MLLHLLREFIIWFGPIIGVTLIGETKEEATSLQTIGKMIAVQFECTESGTLEELHVIASKTWGGTASFLGIAEENAGAPGAILATKESAEIPKEKIAFVMSGFSLKINKGTKYWLIAKTNSTASSTFMLGKTGGTATVRRSTATFSKIEATSEWVAAVSNGPLSFWGTGTAGGGKVGEGVAEIKGGGRILTTGVKQVESPSTIRGGGKIATTGIAVASSATTTIRAGGRITTTAIAIALSPTIVIQGGGRILTSTGAKTAEGVAVIRGGGRIVTSGTRVASGGATMIRSGGRITSTGQAIATGASVIRGGGRVTTTSRVIVSGITVIRGGGRIVTTSESMGTKVRTMYLGQAGTTTSFPSKLIGATIVSSEEGSQ